jgi:hypothetical protein
MGSIAPFLATIQALSSTCVFLLTAFVLWPSYNSHLLGVHFFRGHISLKNRTYSPFLATIQRLSKAPVFLLRVKISEGCFVSDLPPAISHPYLIFETNSWKIRGGSWESTPARVKAIIKYKNLKYLCLYKNCWYSGTTGLVRWNSPWIESLSDQRILLLKLYSSSILSMLKIFYFFYFCYIFFTPCFC